MNIFIMLAIVIANVIAVLLIYQFIKKLTKMDKIIFIAGSFAIAYILVSIIYWISGFGIDSRINDGAKDFITYIFVPVNVIILAPFVATKYNKWKTKEIEKEEFIKRLILIGIIAIIILIIECFYFRNIKQNIMDTAKSAELKGQETNTILENAIDDNETGANITNEVKINITNAEVVNETSNTVSKNVVENTLNQNELE